MSTSELRAAAQELATKIDREMAIMLAVRERLSEAHIQCAQVFEGTSRQDIIDALTVISEVYTDVEEGAGKLGLAAHALQAYAEGL